VAAGTGPVGVGVIGAGTISDTYLENLSSFPDVEVVAIGDLFPEAAKAKAEQYGVGASGDVSAVLDNPDVEIVVNLTIPAAHAEVASAALTAGKHVWNEKPLTLDRESASALLEQADAARLRVGCAPDTFLGGGVQDPATDRARRHRHPDQRPGALPGTGA
jgi:predicted dehydrogenase